MFYHGHIMRDDLKITLGSDILFSDCCMDGWYPESRIKVSRDCILFCRGKKYKEEINQEVDLWDEYEEIEFCPWDNILEIYVNGSNGKLEKKISKENIEAWRLRLESEQLVFPYTNFSKGSYVFIIEGTPPSERSQNDKPMFYELIETLRNEVKSVLPEPVKGLVDLRLDIFTTKHKVNIETNKGNFPDLDRKLKPIGDSLQGIIYEDDRQIHNSTGKIWDVSNVFEKLECVSGPPMDLYTFENISIGALLPLSKGITDYYVFSLQTYLE